MIRKISKIVALILITTSFSTISPIGISNINAKADTTSVATSASSTEAAYAAVAQAELVTKLSGQYPSAGFNPATDVVSQFEPCGTLSYTLSDTAASTIATSLQANIGTISAGLTSVYNYGQYLSAYGPTAEYRAKGAQLVVAVGIVQTSLASGVTTTSIKEAAKSVPVYKYTVKRGTNVVAQGFAVGGPLGLATFPSDTLNGTGKNATYSSANLIPALPLSGNSTYGKTIDLSAVSMNVICDGLDINVVDSTNNKVYAINNPVYKMLKYGSSAATQADTLNVIDFSGVTNLKGVTNNIDLSSMGISTNVLGISLTTNSSTNKVYLYDIPVDAYEKNMIVSYLTTVIPSTYTTVAAAMIKPGTYAMVPDFNNEISNSVSGITNNLDKISDSIDDLSNAIKDKSDDVDNAWDKVFDRFDNSEGWGKRDGYVYYYDKDGVSLKGVQKINGKTYYFNRIDGAMETGWQIVDGNRAYFDKKKGYELFNQWIQDGDDYYFVGEDGAVKKMDWVNVGGKSYYLKADGKRAKDWIKIDDYWYDFNADGSMVTSAWKKNKDKWCYLKDNGQAATNWLQLGDKWYCFKDPSGELQTGWFRADGSWYYSNSDGVMQTGWASSNDGWSYLDDSTGKMKKNEWVTVNGNTYYFNVNGIMVTGTRYIDGTKYVFNSDGTLS
ncbi:glucan-binding YG repeat protein [Clostridium saccharoperbutylacetonicum]|uniref:Glucan-binding domain-containing protein n=1 Tax=Clostridium saccharoperbutylacetonicum N1-4(HMT) TaxID=931276 RepID=M1MML3_9CLOT|nr:N-acetylmuramoyl-L-alanine amidase family protein [Clostridium saccharoperbutylacetonicum]AGF59139.1 glucan-binding domain-containing protein [Clostridium saccharoperbutylacetonicum N1-4(HMT)]NRT60073.1 glucan-binding YG repeat protein [Clostridium saccharoperbutylacetonicum]NSB23385.1 glucan-binding YG repeat protein [Clostridium saccharoperbutylacetonicum]NSB42755.1 glucan-binding YG repeat protein [Clostridium saccharoperbutylacetonicum]